MGYRFGTDVDVNQNLVAAVDLKEPSNVSSNKAVAVVSEAQAGIVVGAGAQLNAAGNIALTAKGISRADIKTVRSGWGITYGNSAPTATIVVQNGVAIDAAGSFTMDARADNNVNVLTYVPSLGESWNVSVSLGIGRSTSLSEIRAGASVKAATASVLAKNTNSFKNTAVAAGFGTARSKDSGYGLTFAFSFNQSSATALVNGMVQTTGDLTVDGRSINTVNMTRSFASVSNTPTPGGDPDGGKPSGSSFDSVKGFLQDTPFQSLFQQQIGGQAMNFRESSMSSGYAAAFTMATMDNGAHALVGDGARLLVGGNLQVVSEAKDPHQFSASGNVGLMGTTSDTNVGGALVYAKAANQATAFVGYNATVDVVKRLDVTSTATVDSPVDPFDLVMALLGLGPATQAEALGAAHAYTEQLKQLVKDKLDVDASKIDISDYLADVLSDESKIGTTFVHAGGSASGGLKIGGGITVLFPYNAATAAIAKGSRVNQRLATVTRARRSGRAMYRPWRPSRASTWRATIPC